ncbi:MAG: beta strand repeat-containing protein [Paracoccaceae bacterium]
MASFNFDTFNTTAQSLSNGEFGFVGQAGSISTVNVNAVTGTGTFEITVLGSIAANGATAIFSNAAASATVINGTTGAIISADTSAINITASTNLTVMNDGLIAGRSSGILFGSVGSAGFNLNNTGTIMGRTFEAINVGLVSGTARINNTGDIICGGNSPAITIVASSTAFIDITNSGILSSADTSDPAINIVTQGTTVLRNSGTLVGGVSVFNNTTAQTSITNSGLIQGDVTTGNGSDILDLRGGQITGTVRGGDGSDVYFIDDGNIFLEESSVNGDVDLVSTWVSFVLPVGFEQLTLRGIGDINGSVQGSAGVQMAGNSGDNRLTGGVGNDSISGGGGQDRLIGNAGNDSYFTTGQDIIIETAGGGIDSVILNTSLDGQDTYTLAANVENVDLNATTYARINGNALSNTIDAGGLAVNITLDGGGGVDTFIGSAGNTTYVTDGGDTIAVDTFGTDTVESSVTFTLTADLENLTLTGSAAINGTGSTGANTIIGNGGRTTLIGGGGSDSMSGGAGNDTFVTDGGDVLTEAAAGGIDTVRSTANHTLGLNLENLILTGAVAASGTGNDAANRITGNAADNVLNGGLGSDILVGKGGVDAFVFNTALSTTNRDRISDFAVGVDEIHVENAVFVGIASGALSAARFVANTTGNATTANQRIIYETDTGKLFYDADGSGAGAKQQFATLSVGLGLTNADFLVI